jgi:hypothetical protein
MGTLRLPATSSSVSSGRRDRPSRAEQETVVRWDRQDDHVHVWSADPVTWRKLERLGIPVVRETRSTGGAVSGRFYRIPRSRFAWGLKRVGTARIPPRRSLVGLPGQSQDVA